MSLMSTSEDQTAAPLLGGDTVPSGKPLVVSDFLSAQVFYLTFRSGGCSAHLGVGVTVCDPIAIVPRYFSATPLPALVGGPGVVHLCQLQPRGVELDRRRTLKTPLSRPQY